uniref:Uncharacterized protein n=1 Tax=virus sp. ctrcb4 TaxID=2825824 RepID=A0A8S5RPL5_9VIRU|nr:MAG TPA: hypothetical protein [virus sp. ctrcb4]DAR12805.1 MAG TPA: hypothetical protein [Crassvirales sp.]
MLIIRCNGTCKLTEPSYIFLSHSTYNFIT